jgi:PAS domain-containing protein
MSRDVHPLDCEGCDDLEERSPTQNEGVAEERFRRVVEAAPSAMVMSNRAGEIAMVNAQAERVFRYS